MTEAETKTLILYLIGKIINISLSQNLQILVVGFKHNFHK